MRILRKFCRYIALLLSLLFLGGCTLFEFEPMEEVQQKEEDKTQLAVQSAEVEPETMVTDDLRPSSAPWRPTGVSRWPQP